jgi:succinate dehydrogenase / fumarate reductase, cytochrome b subunit
MAAGKRPLSPHLQIYRPQWTTVLSISHRFTGLALALSFPLLVYWLVALASGDAAYATALGWFGTWPVKLVLFAASFAFFYHLANGIRHLAWDTGRGFELSQAYASGVAVVIAAVLLTVLSWAFWLSGGGS